jgi:hypothetical protein
MLKLRGESLVLLIKGFPLSLKCSLAFPQTLVLIDPCIPCHHVVIGLAESDGLCVKGLEVIKDFLSERGEIKTRQDMGEIRVAIESP